MQGLVRACNKGSTVMKSLVPEGLGAEAKMMSGRPGVRDSGWVM